MSPIRDSVVDTARALFGSRYARRTRADALRSHTIADGVAALTARNSDGGSAEEPIFIFSAGWRSGSTLLQRLLMSGGDTLVWGEPYDRACLVQRLAATVRPFAEDWPPPAPQLEMVSLQALPQSWVANLYPPERALPTAYRSLLEQLFKIPAVEHGASRWGFKEVRLGADEARFLRWLYPRARFLFLYRCPYAAYRSYKAFQAARGWYVRWPDQHAFTVWAFARHWRRLTGEFVVEAERLDALLVPYEALAAGTMNERIADYCDLALDPAALHGRVGSGREREGRFALTDVERKLIQWATAPLASRLGYRGERPSAEPAPVLDRPAAGQPL